MEGAVNAAHEAVLTLSLEGSAGETQEIAAVIDTGFTGFLTVTPALAVELSPRLEAEQHLEGGTAYRQVRSTRLDKIENLRAGVSVSALREAARLCSTT